jgi:hypothetical protein
MASEKEELKDQHRKPKCIVIGGPNQSGERLALQFRGRMGRNADGTKVVSLIMSLPLKDLKAVAVDQLYHSLLGNEHAAMVDIADDMTMLMYSREGAREIRRSMDEKRQAGIWELAQPRLGAIENVYLTIIPDPRHEQPPNRSSWSVVKRVNRPRGKSA